MAAQAATADRFAAAHRALVADGDVQFALTPTPPPAEPPEWLKGLARWLGRLFDWLPDLPYARILLWSVVALVAAVMIAVAVERLRYGEWRRPSWWRRRPAVAAVAVEEEWAPDAAPAREWLREADALAAAGRYAEAAHLLLLRSVEDLGRRRPGAVRPALTARELAAAPAFPVRARELFAGIARLVERSLFGGRAVDAADWANAREAYADFALAGAWRG